MDRDNSSFNKVSIFASYLNCDGHVYNWIEDYCPRTMRLIERRMIGFNGNEVKDTHQMHSMSRSAPRPEGEFLSSRNLKSPWKGG